MDHLIHHNAGGAGLRNGLGNVRKQLLQLGRVRRNGYMLAVRVRGPFMESRHVDSIRAGEPNAVNDNAGVA